MPNVPDSGDVTSVGRDSVVDGAVYGLGTGIGSGFGPVGSGLGGVLAGASIGGQKGETLATFAVGQALGNMLFAGGGGQQGVK